MVHLADHSDGQPPLTAAVFAAPALLAASAAVLAASAAALAASAAAPGQAAAVCRTGAAGAVPSPVGDPLVTTQTPLRHRGDCQLPLLVPAA